MVSITPKLASKLEDYVHSEVQDIFFGASYIKLFYYDTEGAYTHKQMSWDTFYSLILNS